MEHRLAQVEADDIASAVREPPGQFPGAAADVQDERVGPDVCEFIDEHRVARLEQEAVQEAVVVGRGPIAKLLEGLFLEFVRQHGSLLRTARLPDHPLTDTIGKLPNPYVGHIVPGT